MKIILTPQESEEYFYNALCSLDYVESGYGLDLLFSRKAYSDAKISIANSDPNQQMCHEDVLMQILKDGGTLNLYDMEAMEDNIITLADVHERVANTQLDHLMDMIAERGDAITDDVIIQTVFFKEIIFG
jgi:hypothetical protein